MDPGPLAFFSCVESNDAPDDGRLTELCQRLEREVRLQTGGTFQILQDRHDPRWGPSWEQRVAGGLDGAAFLIAVITPGYLTSAVCRAEFDGFLDREEKMGRKDLILPVLYLDTPVLAAEPGDWGNRLAEAMTKRFWADWRDLRHEPWTSADAGKRLAAIAARIRVALERDPHAKVSAPAPLLADFLPPAVDAAESAHIATGQCKPPPLVGPNEPRTWVVDPLAGRGDFRTISEAIQTAAPGDRLLVHPGCYQEGLRLEKPLEIIGHGKVDEIVVAASGRDAVFFAANFGRVANLTLRQTGGGPFYAVDIGQGRLELEGCDISSRSLAAIAIHGRADPAIRRNRIHDGLSCGVLVYEHGQGALEDNDIFGHALSAVEIKDGGHPVLRRNHLHDGQGAGLFVHHDGRGAFEDNEISGCATVGVAIQNGGNPLLRRNRIHGSAQSGVLVYEHGKGVLEDNDIAGNGSAGVMIKTGGAPTVRRNTINYNSKYGIIVWENSGGVFESNNLANNQPGPVYVHESSKGWIKVVGNIE